MRKGLFGVTIIEVIVAITIASIIAIGLLPQFILFMTRYFDTMAQASQSLKLAQVEEILTQDLVRAKGFLRTSPPTPHIHTFSEDAAGNHTLIMQVPATTTPYRNDTKELVWYADKASDCSAYQSRRYPLLYTAIYYIDGTKLYKKTFLQPPHNMVACDHTKQPYQKSETIKLVDGAIGLKVAYHGREETAGNPAAYDPISTSNTLAKEPLPYHAATVKITHQQPSANTPHTKTITLRSNPLW